MFPDLTSDDIFQIETERLWLRWPKANDAAAIQAFASRADVAHMTAEIPHPYPKGEAERFVLQARADNASGRGLVLAITEKSHRHVIGIISAHPATDGSIEVGYALSPQSAGKGFATEALKGFVDTLFRFNMGDRLFANVRVINPASRRVLEKCGFHYIDSGLDNLPARGGLHPCDRFALERSVWLKGPARKSLPSMLQQTRGAGPASDIEVNTE